MYCGPWALGSEKSTAVGLAGAGGSVGAAVGAAVVGETGGGVGCGVGVGRGAGVSVAVGGAGAAVAAGVASAAVSAGAAVSPHAARTIASAISPTIPTRTTTLPDVSPSDTTPGAPPRFATAAYELRMKVIS